MSRRVSEFPRIKTGSIAIADTTALDVTTEFPINDGARLRIDVLVTARPTGVGAVTLGLYTGTIVDPTTKARYYALAKTVNVTSAVPATLPGIVSITLNPEVAGDQPALPTGQHGVLRAVSDGAVGSVASFSVVAVTQEG